MNELLEAAESGNRDGDSESRYEKLKKEEAGTVEKDPAKQRYEELKEKAKKEMIRKENQSQEPDEEDENESFVTY